MDKIKLYKWSLYILAFFMLLLNQSCQDKGYIDSALLQDSDLYMFGFGGDINDDGVVDIRDSEILKRGLENKNLLFEEMDVDRNGIVDKLDLDFIEDIIAQKRMSLLSVDFFEDDVENNEPAMLLVTGMNFNAGCKVRLGEEEWTYSEAHFHEEKADSFLIYWEEVPKVLDSTTSVYVVNGDQKTMDLSLSKYGINIGNNEESTPLGELYFQKQEKPEETPIDLDQTDCCISFILFKGHMEGVRIFAYNDSGTEATNSGQTLKSNKNLPLNSEAKNITIRLIKDKMEIGSWTFNCENIERKIYNEKFNPIGEGGTMVRPQPIFEIVDFRLKQPCNPPEINFPTGVVGGIMDRDNAEWGTDDPYPGSGAVTMISVPKTSIIEMGCQEACWVQYVSTGILKWDPTKGKWTTLFHSKFHIDNRETSGEPMWACYQEQYEEDGKLIIGDGPHLVHSDSLWIGGKLIVLEDGDKLLRHSVFITELICIDPEYKVLAAFTWSIHTTFEYNESDISVGGKTTIDSIQVINIKQLPSKKDKADLKKYLKKKEKDLKKCPF